MAKPALFALMLALPACCQATERPVPAPVPDYQAHRAKGKIIIDGRADESAWKNAADITLQFPWDEQTGAKQTTSARLLWDDDHLYVVYTCEDADITTRHTRRDAPTYEDDAVELFISADANKSDYVGLEMNARGVLYDYFKSARGLDKSYDLKGVRIAAQQGDGGWVLELAIPLVNFTTPVAAGTVWKININRWDGSEPHRRLSMWSDSGRLLPNPHQPERFGLLRFVE